MTGYPFEDLHRKCEHPIDTHDEACAMSYRFERESREGKSNGEPEGPFPERDANRFPPAAPEVPAGPEGSIMAEYIWIDSEGSSPILHLIGMTYPVD